MLSAALYRCVDRVSKLPATSYYHDHEMYNWYSTVDPPIISIPSRFSSTLNSEKMNAHTEITWIYETVYVFESQYFYCHDPLLLVLVQVYSTTSDTGTVLYCTCVNLEVSDGVSSIMSVERE